MHSKLLYFKLFTYFHSYSADDKHLQSTLMSIMDEIIVHCNFSARIRDLTDNGEKPVCPALTASFSALPLNTSSPSTSDDVISAALLFLVNI